jgi:hypothetical protein
MANTFVGKLIIVHKCNDVFSWNEMLNADDQKTVYLTFPYLWYE